MINLGMETYMTDNKHDAPSPEAMHVEMTNYLRAHSGGKLSETKAASLIEGIIALQMQYYARMATPEVTEDAQQVVNALHELMLVSDRTIKAGAKLLVDGVTLLSDRTQWQEAAIGQRAAVDHVLSLLT